MPRKQYLIGFLAALAVMLVTGTASYQSTRQAHRMSESTARSHRVLDRIVRLRALISEVESGARGYVATGVNQLREPFHATYQQISSSFRELQQLSEGNPGRKERLNRLCPMISERLSLAERIIELRRFQGFEAAAGLIGTNGENKAAADIAGLLLELERDELAALAAQEDSSREAGGTVLWIMAVGSGLVAGAFAIPLIRSRREFAACRKQGRLLLENHLLLRDLLENTSDLVMVAAPDLRLVYVNQRCRETLGYAEEAVLGTPLQQIIHPDRRAGWAAETGNLHRGEATGTVRTALRAADGRAVFVSADISASTSEGRITAYRFICRETGNARRQEESLRRTNEQLMRSVALLERRASELGRLGRASELLHSSVTAVEAHRVVAQAMPQLIPSLGGALLILGGSRSRMHAVANWGESPAGETDIPADECLALRRGREHISNGQDPGFECGHPCRPEAGGYACLPLIAHGEAFGVLHLEEPPALPVDAGPFRDRLADSTLETAAAMADQIALALASLGTRETLQQQTARDPLTRLFSRSYMEEELDRQLRRAARKGRSVAVALIGLDHFKRFNESLGLAAGDTMLRNVGKLIEERVRREDTTCRFGGDQFGLVLPEASLETVLDRSEALRRQVKQVKVQVRQEFLGSVTLSAGVAAYPEHGDSAEAILRAAGRALHKAKSEGRDRVSVASM
ncbi:MAG: diguanylate cyclase [Acidobacteria bacterium]|nr:diguanylate cyclase [Acidobacteriota bacterium]